MTPRVRFAPSPTGTLHIGGARTALYNFLYARHTGGAMILRIEDTDRARSTPDSLATILDGLRWIGIRWDEGPFFQSERLPLYRDAAERLVKAGRAYEREDPGKGKALVFAIDRGAIEWDDLVHGRIGRDVSADPDLVILKSDGWPTYNFAVVVDDLDMKITHVLRADEHVSNTPKQISLCRALGADPPRYAHVPLILNPDGSKMSKDYRKKGPSGVELTYPTALLEYRRLGYFPEAVANFLALLGWSPGDDREILSMEEMIEAFDLSRVQRRGAQFHVEKLDWLNGVYIRRRSVEELAAAVRPFLELEYGPNAIDEARLRQTVRQQQERLRTLADIVPLTEFVFRERVEPDPEAVRNVLGAPTARRALGAARQRLARLDWSNPGALEAALRETAASEGLRFQDVAQPIRVAVTGKTASPPIHETLILVGRDRALSRIAEAMERAAP